MVRVQQPVWLLRYGLPLQPKSGISRRPMAKDKKTKLLEESIKNPASANADELKKFGLDLAKVKPSLETAKEILEDPDGADRGAQFAKLDFPVKLALLGLLGQEGAGGFLARLQKDEKDKAVSKAIAQAIHLVRAQGVNVKDMREKGGIKFDFASEGIPDSYLSAIDTEGNRLVLLARVSPVGRLNVFHAVCGDTQGLTNFEGLGLTRAAYRRFIQMAEAQMGVPLAKVSSDWAAWLIAEAARVSVKNGLPTPPAYEDAKTMIEPPATAPAHPVKSALSESDLEDEHVSKGAELHQLPQCAFWVPDEATLETLSEKVKEADESKVAVGEDQKKDLRLRAAKELREKFWTKENRSLWARRLEDTAHVLAVTGSVEEGKIAWASARALESSKDAETIPFATELFDKIVKHAGALQRAHSHEGHVHEGVGNAMHAAAAEDEAGAEGSGAKP